MRVLVCGGRDYNDRNHIWNVLYDIHAKQRISVIIHGAAAGADRLAMDWAQTMPGVCHAPFVADWHTHGRAGGPIRNQRMLDDGRPDLIVAFPGGKGTADMVRRAAEAGIRIIHP